VHVVTLLEEMPVQETADAIAELTALGISLGSIIVNAGRPPLLTEGRISQAELRRGLLAAGLPADRDTVAGLRAEADAHLTRLAIEDGLRVDLAAIGRPLIELPWLAEGVGTAADGAEPAGLLTLAEALAAAGTRTATLA
jgi:hypothetical protein